MGKTAGEAVGFGSGAASAGIASPEKPSSAAGAADASGPEAASEQPEAARTIRSAAAARAGRIRTCVFISYPGSAGSLLLGWAELSSPLFM